MFFSSPEDKQRMLEMLKRLEEQSDSEGNDGCGLDMNSDPTENLEERLAGLDLGTWVEKTATMYETLHFFVDTAFLFNQN